MIRAGRGGRCDRHPLSHRASAGVVAPADASTVAGWVSIATTQGRHRRRRRRPPGDRTTLTAGIRDVYNQPAKAARIARAGRELLLQEFDPLVNARLLTSLILRQR